MALSIKHHEADRLARELAQWTGESLTEAVLRALRERLDRVKRQAAEPSLSDELQTLRQRWAALPVLDDERSPDAILGYDDQGLPT